MDKDPEYYQYKPINILLNCKFERGKFLDKGFKEPITIFSDKIEPKKIHNNYGDFLG